MSEELALPQEVNEFGLPEDKMDQLANDYLHLGYDRMAEEDRRLLDGLYPLLSTVEYLANRQREDEEDADSMAEEIAHGTAHEMY